MKSLLTSKLLPSRLQYRISKNRGCSTRDVEGFGLFGRTNKSLGFTLIELMVAIAIIGILFGIGVPAYIVYLEKAKVVTAVAEIKMIMTEIEAYRAINDEALPNSLSAVNYQGFHDPWGKPYKYKKLEVGGGASLGPSFASAKEGAKVIVLAKRHTLGGNPAMANGLFPAESAFQKRLMIDIPRDELFRAAMDFDHSPAKGLTIDGRIGVTGVRATIIKETIKTTSKGVIVTTGGYGGNKRLLKAYSPAYHKNIMLVGSPLMEDGLLLLAQGGGPPGGGPPGGGPPGGGPPPPPPPGGGAGKEDANGFSINTDYDLYSSGKDGASNKKLTHKNSMDDIIRADNGLFIGPVSKY